ncbi:MAG TPA: hypothetical protein VF525_14340 [Pyrinomonadaceae bacterium]|jgi:heme-degrading monooxygenase HmoA
MFTRQVTMKLKRNAAPELTLVIEQVIMPLLRKQPGFRDQLTLIAADRLDAVSYTFWASQADAETYNRTTYPEELRAMMSVIEKNPRVQTFEVANSTFQQFATAHAA